MIVNMENWLTVSPTSGFNNYNLTVNAEVNDTLSERTRYIKVYSDLYDLQDYCKAVQAKRAEETISVSPLTYEVNNFHYSQSNIRFDVTTNYSWTASTEYGDIVLSTSAGTGSGSVYVSIDPDNTISSNVRTIVFSTRDDSVTVVISQKYPSFIKYATTSGDAVIYGEKTVKRENYWYAFLSGTTAPTVRNNTDLTYVEFDGIEVIPAYGLSGCTNISTVVFNNGLRIIGNCAFFGVSHITNQLYFPPSITGATSGKWFENTLIDHAIIDCDLNGSTNWNSYSTESESSGTTSVLGRDVTATTVELRSNAVLHPYSLALGESRIIIREGVSPTVPEHLYSFYLHTKHYGSSEIETYNDKVANNGQVILDEGLSVTTYSSYLPNSNWTITNTE